MVVQQIQQQAVQSRGARALERPEDTSRNEVHLVGRLAGAPQERELPSGDLVVAFRLVVQRRPGRPAPDGVRVPTVDTIDCVAWTAGLRRTVLGLVEDDVVEVHGALRRRFWRAGAGAVSRYEVEAATVRRLSRRRRPPP